MIAMKHLGMIALLATGCVVTSAATEGAQLPQEHCPFEGAPMLAARPECPPEVLEPFVQSVSEMAHRHWDPQRDLSEPNRTIDRYGGRALMTVLGVSVDARGSIAAVDVAKSSGDDEIDRLAIDAVRKGHSTLYPPACALRDAAFQFRLGLCLEVEHPRQPRLHFAWPQGEPRDSVQR